MTVFAVVEVGLLAVAKTGFAGHLAIAKLIDIVAVGFGSDEAISLRERVLKFG